MPINIREGAAEDAVRTLADRLGVSLTEAIRVASVNELKRINQETPLATRVAALRDRLEAAPRVCDPAPADKAFFDDLSGP